MNNSLFRYRAYLNMAMRTLGFRPSLPSAASKVEVIQAKEEEPVPHLFCLPGQLERATKGVPGHSTLAEELDAFLKKSNTHAPVIRYTLRDCLVHSHGVEFFGGYEYKSGTRFQRVPTGPMEEISEAAYCMSTVAHQYFGHWLTDACATTLLARPEEATLLDVRNDWPNTEEYVKAFNLHPNTSANARVRELSVFQDFSQGSSKRQRYATLRERAAKHFGIDTQLTQHVYLRRGRTGVARFVRNEDEVVQCLQREGFLVLDVAGCSSRDIFRTVANAPMVISMDGSHMSHLYFSMRPGSRLLSFVPADRLTAVHFGYTAALGIHFGIQVLDKREDGYEVDINAMMRTLELFPA